MTLSRECMFYTICSELDEALNPFVCLGMPFLQPPNVRFMRDINFARMVKTVKAKLREQHLMLPVPVELIAFDLEGNSAIASSKLVLWCVTPLH